MVSDIKIEWFIWDTEWLQRFVLETGDFTLDQGAREIVAVTALIPHWACQEWPPTHSLILSLTQTIMAPKWKCQKNNEPPIDIQLWHLEKEEEKEKRQK